MIERRAILAAMLLLAPAAAGASTLDEASAGAFLQQIDALLRADPGAALERLEAAAPVPDAAPALRARLALRRSQANDALSYPEPALQWADRGLALVAPDRHPELHFRLTLARTNALISGGSASAAVPEANAAVRWAEDREDPLLLVDALSARAQVWNTLGDYVNALDDLRRAYALVPESAPAYTRPALANLIALVYEYSGDDALSIPYFEEYIDHYRRAGNDFEVSIGLYGLGRAHRNLGADALGREELRESLVLARAAGDLQGVAYALKELSSFDAAAGARAAARGKLLGARAIFARAANRYMLFDVSLNLFRLALRDGSQEQARRWLEDAGAAIDPEDMPQQWVRYLRAQALLHAGEGRFGEAIDLTREAAVRERRFVSERSARQLHELRTRYDLAAAEQETSRLAAENALQAERIEAQAQGSRLLTLTVVFVGVSAILLLLLVQRSNVHRRRLEKLANFDSLTELYSRRRTLAGLSAALERQAREDGRLCVALIDLDHFKEINDSVGHAVGDRVLAAFGSLCRDFCDGDEFAGRIGGEEFLLVLPGCDLGRAGRRLEALRIDTRALGPELGLDQRLVSFSAGLCAPCPGATDTEVFACIDALLYAAKDRGRDQILVAAAPGEAAPQPRSATPRAT